mgnify:CR=1 FL=1
MRKNNDMLVSAVITAAGKSRRMKSDISKQYIDIEGMPVLARSIKAIHDCNIINEIIVVVDEKDILFCKENIIDAYGFWKVKVLAAGGNERQESVFNGLKEVNEDCSIVIIHDGARPFVHKETIEATIEDAMEYGASCAAVPVKDTIKVAGEGGFVLSTLNRNTLWSIQTPQAFSYPIIMEAHRKAIENGFAGTDDTSLVEALGYKVKITMGTYDNIKITTPEDLMFAEVIAKSIQL